jgi:hypothetical protein
MAPRGRPPLSEDVVRERIAAYCARYRVRDPGSLTMPPFPSGKRETRQHRDWVVLYKAVDRLQRRQLAGDPNERAAAIKSQKGRCPICLGDVGAEDGAILRTAGRLAVLHAACNDVVGFVARLDPPVLDRLRDHAWPSSGSTSRDKRR